MYPIQTKTISHTIPYFSDMSYIKTDRIQKQQLILHSDPGCLYQHFNILMPYIILYEAISKESNVFVCLEFSENNFNSFNIPYDDYITTDRKLHSHDFYELTYVLSGHLKMKIENEIITYHPGDCCLCNKNIHHVELMDEDTEVVLFLFKEDFIREMHGENYFYDDADVPRTVGTFFDSLFSENVKNTMYDAKVYIDFILKNSTHAEQIYPMVNSIIEEITKNRSGKSHMMKGLICRFLEQLEDACVYDANFHWADISREEQIVCKIAQAYESKEGMFSRTEIEDITGYNCNYIERIMKKNTGKTLTEYGRSFLVRKAAALIADSDLPIGEICLRLGYSNRRYFNRIFAQNYGVVPSEYRKNRLSGNIKTL